MGIQVKKSVKKIVEPVLATYDFKPDPAKTNASGYCFARDVNGVRQTIEIERGTYPPQSLRLYLNTSVDVAGATGAGLKKDATYTHWIYQDQVSLEDALQEMIQLVEEVGIFWLAVSSIPIPPVPMEAEKSLFDNHSLLAQEYCKLHNLELSDSDALLKVEALWGPQTNSPKILDWDVILYTSAFFGEFILHHLGGYWEWDDINSQARIKGLGGKPLMKTDILPIILRFWFRRPFDSLQEIWRTFEEKANSPYHYV